MSTLIGVWKTLILTLLGDFEGLKISVQKITGDTVEITRKLHGT
jgi:hypothetical protein